MSFLQAVDLLPAISQVNVFGYVENYMAALTEKAPRISIQDYENVIIYITKKPWDLGVKYSNNTEVLGLFGRETGFCHDVPSHPVRKCQCMLGTVERESLETGG